MLKTLKILLAATFVLILLPTATAMACEDVLHRHDCYESYIHADILHEYSFPDTQYASLDMFINNYLPEDYFIELSWSPYESTPRVYITDSNGMRISCQDETHSQLMQLAIEYAATAMSPFYTIGNIQPFVMCCGRAMDTLRRVSETTRSHLIASLSFVCLYRINVVHVTRRWSCQTTPFFIAYRRTISHENWNCAQGTTVRYYNWNPS